MTTGERLLALLPATRADLLGALAVGKATLHRWLTRLKTAKRIRIVAWRRTVGDIAAVFGLGPGKNARRPSRIPHAQVQAKYRNSLKAAGVYEDELATQRKRNARRTPPVVPFASDPLLGALFGVR